MTEAGLQVGELQNKSYLQFGHNDIVTKSVDWNVARSSAIFPNVLSEWLRVLWTKYSIVSKYK
jgi:hypothetical protein